MGDSLHFDVFRLLRDTTGRLKVELRKKIESNGITWQQFHALFHIRAAGVPANELAKELHCNASNMTGLVDRMTQNGWVYRERSEKDRRVWLVKLTEKGAKLKNKLLPKHRENIKERMGVLNDKDLCILQDLLKKLKDKTKEEDKL